MRDLIWNIWGGSVIGPLHARVGIPNQDSWLVRRYKRGNVVVVSDGLGSKLHSDHGSKAACFAVFEAAKFYLSHPQANIADILRLIHALWLVKVSPHSPADCSATCLFAIQTGGKITLGRIGDGMIAVYGESPQSSFILSENKQDSFSNYTQSLRQEFRPDHWDTITIDDSSCKAVVLCTDGISEDLLPEKQMGFVQELFSSYSGLTRAKRKKDLSRWLNEWPVPGHSDDKTIACLFKKGGFQ